ncbi:MAG: hybrid sensor histidine kinase/response regulator [Methanomassiliicoccus sp.]|nr:hybrid sensor histidine kinase/response regulator [Methanomassiliicoccus sp.]
MQVLFVDDDPKDLESCADLLGSDGSFKVDTACSGESALDMIASGNYDAVVSDYMTALSMNGVDLLRNARAMGYLNTFLLVSRNADEDIVLDAILNGVDQYLPRTGDVCHDISMVRSFLETRQRRMIEEKERKDEAAYHSLLMRMEEGFAYHRIIYDERERAFGSVIIDVNDAFERVFARPGESVLGQDVRRLITDHEGFEHEMLKAFDGIIKDGREVRFTARSEPLDRWFSVALYTPEPGYFVTILTDLTGQKKLEEELTISKRKLSLMGSITMHDLMNQLTILYGYLDIARSKKDTDSMRDYIAKASVSGEKMRKAMQFSQDYLRMGEQSPEWFFAHEAVAKGIAEAQMGEAAVIIDLKGLEIYADPLIHKVFHNLGFNAVRHGNASEIRFTYEMRGEDLVIVCLDNGSGIRPEKRREMFDDRFGHGLYLVREILGITGMTIRETAPAQGALFEILVPRGRYRFV